VHDGKTKVVHINFTVAQVDELYKPSLQVVGDLGNVLWQLCEAQIDTSKWNFDSLYQAAAKADANREANIDKDCCDVGVTPAWLIRQLRGVLGEQDIVALDNGLYKVWFARNYPAYAPNTLLLDNALATMGA
jgi:acetolactate synthase-1/2/3 large subunit